MKAFIQRVTGKTEILSRLDDGEEITAAFEGPGLVVLLGWTQSDGTRQDLKSAEDWIYSRAVGLRVFPDADGKMNLSLMDYANGENSPGGILWVPQFTLAGKLESGFRPSFTDAMAPEAARVRFDQWVEKLAFDKTVKHIHGHFGADMKLSFTNWGPLSLSLEK